MSDHDYLKLTTKARSGDQKSAETLARLWYQYGEDNTKALYWLEVAAQNGSQRAERIAQIAKKTLPD